MDRKAYPGCESWSKDSGSIKRKQYTILPRRKGPWSSTERFFTIQKDILQAQDSHSWPPFFPLIDDGLRIVRCLGWKQPITKNHSNPLGLLFNLQFSLAELWTQSYPFVIPLAHMHCHLYCAAKQLGSGSIKDVHLLTPGTRANNWELQQCSVSRVVYKKWEKTAKVLTNYSLISLYSF